MPNQDKDKIARSIANCTPLDKYASVIDWYDDFKKRLREEIRSGQNKHGSKSNGNKQSSKKPISVVRAGSSSRSNSKGNVNRRVLRNTMSTKKIESK